MSNNMLKGRIVQVYGTQARFAKALGISPQLVNYKCRTGYRFRADELAEWCRLLKIEPDGFMEYWKGQSA